MKGRCIWIDSCKAEEVSLILQVEVPLFMYSEQIRAKVFVYIDSKVFCARNK